MFRSATKTLAFTSARGFTPKATASSRALSSLLANKGSIASALQQVSSASALYSHQSPSPSSSAVKSIRHKTMFCRQCEQTQDHVACTTNAGVCGKTAETSACQDVLIHVIKRVSQAVVQATAGQASAGHSTTRTDLIQKADIWVLEAAFSTLTNVNFSEERIVEYVKQGHALLADFRKAHNLAIPRDQFEDCKTIQEFEAKAPAVSVPARLERMNNPDAFSLNEIATYGLKGLCAYAAHAYQLRQDIHANFPSATGTLDDEIFQTVHETWAKLLSDEPDMDGLLKTALNVGSANQKVMEALDNAHAELLGISTPTQVRTTAVEGKCILVSGHDMVDLYHLLKDTEGLGINVYTHGEMLPAHGYPKLHEFKHLAGNFGTAWQNQNFEFASFPGPVLVTTNCIMKPRRVYQDRLWTINQVGFDGVKHIEDRDFKPLIEQALETPGFPRTIEPAKYHAVGFNHRAVMPLAGQVIEAATSGALSRILLIGGCDGSQFSRNYFTELAEASPEDSLILTLGCAKNRIIHSDKLHGQTLTLPNGTKIPRVLDMGQCNDAYSALVVATELAKALKCSVNELPLSLALSHLEQKAAAVLLTLLANGVQNIRLGPSLPAYVTPGILKVLQDNFNLMGTDDAAADMKLMMSGK